MVKWWSNGEPFSPEEERLVQRLYEAHAQCVYRDNCSTAALVQAAGGSRSLTQGYIAALASLGEMHGPIEAAYDVLRDSGTHLLFAKIPGFGNSFIKGRIDDAFLPVDQTLEQLFPRTHNRLKDLTGFLHSRGKKVFPNPAAYTAGTALILGMPRHLAPMLFVQARLEAWASVFHQVMTTKPETKKEAA